jgi:hypothetical protein
MKSMILTACLLSGSMALHAQGAGDFGTGVFVGDATGLTAKYWFDKYNAMDIGLGFDDRFTLHADYLIHSWQMFPQPASGNWGAVLGLGAVLKDTGDENIFGIRAPIGTSYSMPYPLELFAEITPVLRLAPDFKGELDGGVGIRFYFRGLAR